MDTDRRRPAWKVGYFALMAALGLAALLLVVLVVLFGMSGFS
jgi:hypothetical protein